MVDPCPTTELVMPEIYMIDITYEQGSAPYIHGFDAVSDIITDGITTYGNCGNYIYTWSTNNVPVGTDYL